MSDYLSQVKHSPPAWAKHLPRVPKHKVCLAHLPTPIMPWRLPNLPAGVNAFVKRDDLTGAELSGNKVRKLEFLISEALDGDYNCVVTAGGTQSNHCRATACASAQVGLECHIVLRGDDKTRQPNLTGNLLLDRMVGANIWQVTKQEYEQHGSPALLERVAQKLRDQGKRPYVVPVGGSNWCGTWGYLQCVEEIREQIEAASLPISDIVLACGSGGTAAGIALGCHLAGLDDIKVHAFGVCDSPEFFERFIREEIFPADLDVDVSKLLYFYQAQGRGYSLSKPEELETIKQVALQTGVLLDPVYFGKALYGFGKAIAEHPDRFGRNVLFIHTGGLFGLYDKADELEALLPSRAKPLFE